MPGALDRLAQVAENLIQKYGSSATIVQKQSGGGYDASTMKNKPSQNEVIEVVVTPPQVNKTLNESNTKDLNTSCFMKGLNINPELLETLNHKNRKYKIIQVNPIYSGEIVAVHELILGG